MKQVLKRGTTYLCGPTPEVPFMSSRHIFVLSSYFQNFLFVAHKPSSSVSIMRDAKYAVMVLPESKVFGARASRFLI